MQTEKHTHLSFTDPLPIIRDDTFYFTFSKSRTKILIKSHVIDKDGNTCCSAKITNEIFNWVQSWKTITSKYLESFAERYLRDIYKSNLCIISETNVTEKNGTVVFHFRKWDIGGNL